jgi:DNA-binding NarL/FixJ family response regulator
MDETPTPHRELAWREATLAEASTALREEVPEVIQVALIEDNLLVREALISLLNRVPDMRVSAAKPNGHEKLLVAEVPDVVLLDLGLENGDSLRVAKGVLRDFPEARVVVMDLIPAVEEISEFVSAGVSGFILKDATIEEVLRTIRAVARGLKVLPDQMTGALFSEIAREAVAQGGTEDHEGVRLTPREREVIDLIAQGMSNKAIGKRLHISTHTVKSHLRNIMEKLTLHSRLQIAAYALKREADD